MRFSKKLFILVSLMFVLAAALFPTFIRAMDMDEYLMEVDFKNANSGKQAFQQIPRDAGALGLNLMHNEKKLGDSAVTFGGKMMAKLLSDPPVHTATYVADVLHNLRVPGVQPAYAQGIGFAGLSPVLNVWKAFRNLSYFLFIIIFVVVGFMIMFRQKISSNAVATVQEALPKIIVTLLLITFSYAIAGLVIDMMYLTIYLITSLFGQFGILNGQEGANAFRTAIFSHNIIGVAMTFLVAPGQQAGEASQAISQVVFGALRLGAFAAIANVFVYLIVAVAIVIAVFRTLFALIMAYINIILAVIFAPLQLLLNAFPGSDTFGNWLKGLVANAAIFPAVTTMLLLGAALIGPEGQADATKLGLPYDEANQFGWINQGKTGFVPPLVGDSSPETIQAIIGLGIIMLLPEVTKLVHEAFQYKASWFGEAAQKNFQAGTEHGPYAWVGGAAKWGGQLATGAISQAGGTILARNINRIPLIRRIQDNALGDEAQRQVDILNRKRNILIDQRKREKEAADKKAAAAQQQANEQATGSSTNPGGGSVDIP